MTGQKSTFSIYQHFEQNKNAYETKVSVEMYFYDYFLLFNVVVNPKTANISLTKISSKIMTKIQFKYKSHSELKKTL